MHRLEEKYEEVHQLIAIGKEKGYLDYEDVGQILPEELSNSDELDEVFVLLDDLGIDYFERRNGLIDAVTSEDVMRVAKRLLDPAQLTIVVVGAPEGLAASTP